MIFKRAVAKLRAQDWTAIAIEFAIVVAGVFVGTWVANRNQAAVEQREAETIVRQLQPGLKTIISAMEGGRVYFGKTDNYAKIALAGWRGDPAVTDDQFVIAAYQASQITGLGLNTVNWSTTYAGDQLSKLSDDGLRQSIATALSLNLDQLNPDAMNSAYRRNVREVIPDDLQDAIRGQCGDISVPAQPFMIDLPATCRIDLPAAKWAAAASDLRARPDLIKELRGHRALISTFIGTTGFFKPLYKDALNRIEAAR